MKLNKLLFIFLSALLTACAPQKAVIENYSASFSAPENLFYQNPLNVSDIGDPFILAASDGKYYMYATSASDGFKVWRSDDMIYWDEMPNPCFRSMTGWESGDFWAPEVYEIDGKYYLYYSARWRENGGLRLGAAISDAPEGPFSPLGDGPILDYGYAAIDAHLFIDDDGGKFLFYVMDCSENIVKGKRQSHIYAVPLADDMITAAGEPVLITKPDQEWELLSSPQWNEGPFVIKENNKYYLFYSGDFYGGRDYSVGYAVAESILGPYVKYENNPILKAARPEISGTGHNMVLKDYDGQLYCVYHSHTNPSIGGGNRQLCIDRMGFDRNGNLYIDGPTITPQLRPGFVNIADTAEQSEDGLSLKWQESVEIKTIAIYATGGDIQLAFDDAQINTPLTLPADNSEPLVITLDNAVKTSSLTIVAGESANISVRNIVVLPVLE